MERTRFNEIVLAAKTPQELYSALVAESFPGKGVRPEEPTPRHGDPRPARAVIWNQGPMQYLGAQICRRMEQVGLPTKIAVGLRTADDQAKAKRDGFSNAGPWESPHQYYEACDFCHRYYGWKVGDDYWRTLVHVVENVEADFDVKLTSGLRDWGWDSAHVQLADWKDFRAEVRLRQGPNQHPSEELLARRFKAVLPRHYKPISESVERQIEGTLGHLDGMSWQRWLQDPAPRPGDPKDDHGFAQVLASIFDQGWPIRLPAWVKKVTGRT